MFTTLEDTKKAIRKHKAELEKQRKSIKPCPFCGENEGRVDSNFDNPCEKDYHVCVRCEYCGARGPETDHKDTAIKEWNKRGKHERA